METIKLANDAGAQDRQLDLVGQGPYALKENLRKLKWPNADGADRVASRGSWRNGQRRSPSPTGRVGCPAHASRCTASPRIVQEARRRFPCVTHATIQNEPNGHATDIAMQGVPNLAMRLYEHLYRDFADALAELDDPQGDFPEPAAGDQDRCRRPRPEGKGDADHQDAWIRYMHANMDLPRDGFPSVLDAYSIHVYWKPGPPPNGEFPGKATDRLDNLETLAKSLGSASRSTSPSTASASPSTPNPNAPARSTASLWNAHPSRSSSTPGSKPAHRKRGSSGSSSGSCTAPTCAPAGANGVSSTHPAPASNAPRCSTSPGSSTASPARTGYADGLLERDDFLISRFTAPAGYEESIVVLNSRHEPRNVRLTGLIKGSRYERAAINANGHAGLSRPNALTADISSGAVTVTVPGRGLMALSTRPIGLAAAG